MKASLVVALLVTVSSTVPGAADQPTHEPYRIARPAERITCFSPGLDASPITSCVIETDAGLILIDTGLSPAMAQRTRARIASELGRDDFRWVINTHSHFDHSNGNQVFADSLIIGHENAAGEMQTYFDGREAWIERRYRYLARKKAEAAKTPEGSPERAAHRERSHNNLELFDDLRSGFQVTPPNIAFSDRLTVTAGDLELRMIWMGPAHVTSDILVHIPELSVLFTGDLFFDELLSVASYTSAIDPDRWLDALDHVLADDDLKVVIGGHGLVFSPQWIAAQRRYIEEVLQAVRKAVAANGSLDEFSVGFVFDERFADVAEQLDVPGNDLASRHAQIIEAFWRNVKLSSPESRP